MLGWFSYFFTSEIRVPVILGTNGDSDGGDCAYGGGGDSGGGCGGGDGG